MIDPKYLDDLAQRVTGSLPAGLNALKSDVERNLRAALEAAIARMDLVTREEFEVQSGVLARTRERLRELEAKIAELEEHAGVGGPG
jgi:BMFP domain-containing protein YqiC